MKPFTSTNICKDLGVLLIASPSSWFHENKTPKITFYAKNVSISGKACTKKKI